MNTTKKNWLVVEGTDFSGKTTLCHGISRILIQSYDIQNTVFQHPGAFEVGEQLRNLVKSNGGLDWLTEQLIPIADYTNFTAKLDEIPVQCIISDRISPITGPFFAHTKNENITEIKELFETVCKLTAKHVADVDMTLILLDTPPNNIISERLLNRDRQSAVDHFDSRVTIRRMYKALFKAMVPYGVMVNIEDTHVCGPDMCSVSELELIDTVVVPYIRKTFKRILLVKQPFEVLRNAKAIIDLMG